jgi:hypothetical protein
MIVWKTVDESVTPREYFNIHHTVHLIKYSKFQ